MRPHPSTGGDEIIAVVRLIKVSGSDEAEFALVVADDWQGRGIGAQLLQRIAEVARVEGVRKIWGTIRADNPRMLRACNGAGFRLTPAQGDASDMIARLTVSEQK